MILSDNSIHHIIANEGFYLVNPYSRENLQPNSYDMCLGGELKNIDGKSIDISEQPYKLKSQEFLLGSTLEKVNMPNTLCGHVDGKSSIGRLGVFVHVSSGFIDSGFQGNITLEIFNCSHKSFELYEGMPICQLVFEQLTTPVQYPYGTRGNHYQDSEGTVLSKYEGA